MRACSRALGARWIVNSGLLPNPARSRGIIMLSATGLFPLNLWPLDPVEYVPIRSVSGIPIRFGRL